MDNRQEIISRLNKENITSVLREYLGYKSFFQNIEPERLIDTTTISEYELTRLKKFHEEIDSISLCNIMNKIKILNEIFLEMKKDILHTYLTNNKETIKRAVSKLGENTIARAIVNKIFEEEIQKDKDTREEYDVLNTSDLADKITEREAIRGNWEQIIRDTLKSNFDFIYDAFTLFLKKTDTVNTGKDALDFFKEKIRIINKTRSGYKYEPILENYHTYIPDTRANTVTVRDFCKEEATIEQKMLVCILKSEEISSLLQSCSTGDKSSNLGYLIEEIIVNKEEKDISAIIDLLAENNAIIETLSDNKIENRSQENSPAQAAIDFFNLKCRQPDISNDLAEYIAIKIANGVKEETKGRFGGQDNIEKLIYYALVTLNGKILDENLRTNAKETILFTTGHRNITAKFCENILVIANKVSNLRNCKELLHAAAISVINCIHEKFEIEKEHLELLAKIIFNPNNIIANLENSTVMNKLVALLNVILTPPQQKPFPISYYNEILFAYIELIKINQELPGFILQHGEIELSYALSHIIKRMLSIDESKRDKIQIMLLFLLYELNKNDISSNQCHIGLTLDFIQPILDPIIDKDIKSALTGYILDYNNLSEKLDANIVEDILCIIGTAAKDNKEDVIQIISNRIINPYMNISKLEASLFKKVFPPKMLRSILNSYLSMNIISDSDSEYLLKELSIEGRNIKGLKTEIITSIATIKIKSLYPGITLGVICFSLLLIYTKYNFIQIASISLLSTLATKPINILLEQIESYLGLKTNNITPGYSILIGSCCAMAWILSNYLLLSVTPYVALISILLGLHVLSSASKNTLGDIPLKDSARSSNQITPGTLKQPPGTLYELHETTQHTNHLNNT
jgi:hypothetical protein